MSTQYDFDDIDPEVIVTMQAILHHEEVIRSAAENIRSEIGQLIGRTIPCAISPGDPVLLATVTGVRGHGKEYRIIATEANTGIMMILDPENIFIALRQFNQANQEA